MIRHTARPLATTSFGALLCLLALSGEPFGLRAVEGPAGAPALQATLEVLRAFTYAGDPLMIRLAVFNTGDQPLSNAAGVDLLGGLKITSENHGRVSLKTKDSLQTKEQPATLAPGAFFGVITDVAPLAAELAQPGVYTLSWESKGMAAAAVTVKVIPRYEPAASYVATLETDFGYLEFDLLGKDSPKHVQNFYDLAHQGFYDGSAMHMVLKGVELRGGDASTSPLGRPFYTLEQEIAKEGKHRRGTLSMFRLPGSNVDDGSQFVVTLGPTPQYDSVLSIFGQLRGGEETLAALEAIPTSGRVEAPYFRPLKPIVVRNVTLKKAAGGR